MSKVKYATGFVKLSMDEFCQPVRPTIGTPVIPLSALTEVVEGLRLALDYYRSKGSQKFNPYEVEQRLEKILTQLEAQGKER